MRMQDLPRHLGQHSGGMVVCQGMLSSVVPLEPASMPGRVVIQWDKDDCADLGIIKVDLLGLGMMAVLEDCRELIPRHYGEEIDFAQLPADDPAVYSAIQKADTVGLFQIESRAQMSSLPRTRPSVLLPLSDTSGDYSPWSDCGRDGKSLYPPKTWQAGYPLCASRTRAGFAPDLRCAPFPRANASHGNDRCQISLEVRQKSCAGPWGGKRSHAKMQAIDEAGSARG